MNTFLKNNPVCGEYIQKILHQETMLFPHFSDEHPQILNCISVLFDAMYEKDTGYELTVFGQFYHFFGLIFSNHYFIENPTRTRRDYKRILQLKQVLEFIEKIMPILSHFRNCLLLSLCHRNISAGSFRK